MKFKLQHCYKLIKTLLQTENEGKFGFELWPRFADFARFFCAFALNSRSRSPPYPSHLLYYKMLGYIFRIHRQTTLQVQEKLLSRLPVEIYV